MQNFGLKKIVKTFVLSVIIGFGLSSSAFAAQGYLCIDNTRWYNHAPNGIQFSAYHQDAGDGRNIRICATVTNRSGRNQSISRWHASYCPTRGLNYCDYRNFDANCRVNPGSAQCMSTWGCYDNNMDQYVSTYLPNGGTASHCFTIPKTNECGMVQWDNFVSGLPTGWDFFGYNYYFGTMSCPTTVIQPQVRCGDGIKNQSWEQCDDGNTNNNDSCDNSCKFRAYCGNGVIDAGEQCDDGNTNNNDSCNNSCQRVSVCTTSCCNGCASTINNTNSNGNINIIGSNNTVNVYGSGYGYYGYQYTSTPVQYSYNPTAVQYSTTNIEPVAQFY